MLVEQWLAVLANLVCMCQLPNPLNTRTADRMQVVPPILENGPTEHPNVLQKHMYGKQTMSKKQIAMCLNLRDVGAAAPENLRTRTLFRSSELLRCANHKYNVTACTCLACSLQHLALAYIASLLLISASL